MALKYKGNSIVDYLKSIGQSSNYSSRAKLAKQQGISNYRGTGSQNTQLLNTLRSGTTQNTSQLPTAPVSPTKTPDTTDTKPTLGTIETGVADVTAKLKETQERIKTEGITSATGEVLKAPEVKNIPPVVSSDDLTDGTKGTPDVEDPQADIITTTYITGLVDDLANKRKTLEDTYKKQLSDLDIKKKDYEKKIADIEAKKETTITENIEPLLSPFREDLEKSERERLKIEKNFFANQKSIQELETLLTQAQAEIGIAEEKTGLASIRNPRIAKIKEDMAGRVGIIEAVMAVRNNQISVAENMIDRSINAITADRNDQLNYFNTLYNFYETQQDKEGNKLFALEADEKDIINSQISLLKDDLAQSQASVDYIKDMMTDPVTADIMEQAGVKLNDTINNIQQKLSDYTYRQEVIDIDNKMEAKGYEHLVLPDQITGKSENELIRQTDSKGVERVYWKEAKVEDVIPTTQDISFSKDGKDYSGMSGLQDYLKDNPNTSYENMRLELAKLYPNMKLKDIESALEVAGYEEAKTGGKDGKSEAVFYDKETGKKYTPEEVVKIRIDEGMSYEELLDFLTRPKEREGAGWTQTEAKNHLAKIGVKTTKEIEEEKKARKMNYDIPALTKIIKKQLQKDYKRDVNMFMEIIKEYKDMTDKDREVIKKLFNSEKEIIKDLNDKDRKDYLKME